MRNVMALIAALAAVFALGACGAAQKNKIPAETELLPYVAPDPDELAGTEPADEDEDEDGEKAPAQNPQK